MEFENPPLESLEFEGKSPQSVASIPLVQRDLACGQGHSGTPSSEVCQVQTNCDVKSLSVEKTPQRELYAVGPRLAWSTVLGAWLLQLSSVGVISAFGVMQTFYVNGFLANESASSISWIGSLQLFLDLALAPLGGNLVDRGYFRAVVTTGSTIFVLCFFMLSLAEPHHYYQVFLSQGLGMGIGVGLIFLPTSVAVSQHFKQRKALAMGIVASSGSFGAILFSIALNHLLNSSLSFGWAIRIVAFITMGCFIVGNMLVSLPPQAPPSLPKDEHMPPEPSSAEVKLNLETKPVVPSLWDVTYITIISMGFISSLGTWFPSFYVQLFAEQHGISSRLAFYAIAIMNISNMFGRIFPNWLGDRWGALDVYAPCVMCCGCIGFAMLGCSTIYGLILFTLFYGFFFGTTISLYLPVIASISPAGVNVGKRMGVALFPVGVASLVGTPISGAILGHNYVWWKGVVFSSVTILMGGVLLAILWITRHRVH